MERPRRSLSQWRVGAESRTESAGVAPGRSGAARLVGRLAAWTESARVGASDVLFATLFAGRLQRKYVLAEVRMRSCQR
jgi:hypothetical protein